MDENQSFGFSYEKSLNNLGVTYMSQHAFVSVIQRFDEFSDLFPSEDMFPNILDDFCTCFAIDRLSIKTVGPKASRSTVLRDFSFWVHGLGRASDETFTAVAMFFSHGVTLNGRSYLICSDTVARMTANTAIDCTEFASIFYEQFPRAKCVFLFEMCRSTSQLNEDGASVSERAARDFVFARRSGESHLAVGGKSTLLEAIAEVITANHGFGKTFRDRVGLLGSLRYLGDKVTELYTIDVIDPERDLFLSHFDASLSLPPYNVELVGKLASPSNGDNLLKLQSKFQGLTKDQTLLVNEVRGDDRAYVIKLFSDDFLVMLSKIRLICSRDPNVNVLSLTAPITDSSIIRFSQWLVARGFHTHFSAERERQTTACERNGVLVHLDIDRRSNFFSISTRYRVADTPCPIGVELRFIFELLEKLVFFSHASIQPGAA